MGFVWQGRSLTFRTRKRDIDKILIIPKKVSKREREWFLKR